MNKMVLATGNTHKVHEFDFLFKSSGFKILSTEEFGGMPFVEETGSDFHTNAFLKARALSKEINLKHCVIADDSGLEVNFLKGEPGIFSARYAGEKASDKENVKKLLNRLLGVPEIDRTAQFRCVLCLIDKKQLTHYFVGICHGNIQLKPSGNLGFGYDPIFVPKGYNKTFAELGPAVKSKLSHRALAVQECKEFLKKHF